MKIPKLPPNGFLEFRQQGVNQKVIAQSERLCLRHMFNLSFGLLLAFLSLALVYFSFAYLVEGDENKLGTFAIGLLMATFVTGFALIAVQKTVQAVWGSLTLTIDSQGWLKVENRVPLSLFAGDFANLEHPLRINLAAVKAIRTDSEIAFSRLLITEKRKRSLTKCVHKLGGGRSKSDLQWLQRWIEINVEQIGEKVR